MHFSLCACVCFNWDACLCLAFQRQVPELGAPRLWTFKG